MGIHNQTKLCLDKFDNIQEFFNIYNSIYTQYWNKKGEEFDIDNMLCFGDDQIDNIAYDSTTKKATFRVVSLLPIEVEFRGKPCKKIFYVFDFEDVEDFSCDIAPEYYISEFCIEKRNNRFAIEFTGVHLRFTFTKGIANRWWME